jgi:two-component system response regulator PilR (NtrC family)
MNEPVSNFANCSVLVVDDEPGMRTALKANFIRHGWKVEIASGVREASRLFELASFDLVVSDIRMRDGDGFEVMREALKSSSNTYS